MKKRIFNSFATRASLVAGIFAFCGLCPGQGVAFSSLSAQTQKAEKATGIPIRWKVVDEKGEPLFGVAVRVDGSTQGAATDLEGYFKFDKINPNARLIFTYVGMIRQIVDVKGRESFTVWMKDDLKQLNEVVVTGYQTINRTRMRGTYSVLKSTDLKENPVGTIDQALKGTMSGVTVTSSGRPGENVKIRVRGTNTLTGNANPIWIIDGMPMQDDVPTLSAGTNVEESLMQTGIGNLAPDDIESITVLKDAAATAIYGAQAANGVIVITTKRGKEGPLRINLTAQFGLTERPSNSVRMMNSAEKIQFERETYNDYRLQAGRIAPILNQVNSGLITSEDAEAQIAALANVNTDWFKELYKPNLNQQISMSFSGGSKRTQHYTSLNFMNERGIEINSGFQRLRANTKLNHQLNDVLSLQTDVAATYRSNENTASTISPLDYAMFANPYESPDGYDLSWDKTLSALRPGLKYPTLNAIEDMRENKTKTQYLEGSFSAKIDWRSPLEGLVFSGHGIVSASRTTGVTTRRAGTYSDYQTSWSQAFYDELPLDKAVGSKTENFMNSLSYTVRATSHYNRDFGKMHHVSAMAGMEASHRHIRTSRIRHTSYDMVHELVGQAVIPDDATIEMVNAAVSNLASSQQGTSKMMSLFVNGSYSYDDRYVIGGSVRYDGSDVIGNNNQFTPLWNISGKWNIFRESFFPRTELINRLSLGASYGFTGSIDKTAYPFVVMRLASLRYYDGQIIPSSYIPANPNIKWQTKRDVSFNLDMALLRERLTLGVNYYNNFVYDLLDNSTLALSSGRSSIRQNVANLRNKGIEFDLSVRVIRSKEFALDLGGNISFNENTVEKTFYRNMSELSAKGSTSTTTSTTTLRDISKYQSYVEGYPVGAWFGYHFAGVATLSGSTLIRLEDGTIVDLDAMMSNSDAVAPALSYLGSQVPRWTGGFNTKLTWRDFSLTAQFEFQGGHKIRSVNEAVGINNRNRYITDASRWRGPGDISLRPFLSDSRGAFSQYFFDSSLESGDYLRCSFLTLGYNVPQQWLSTFGIGSARLSFTASNLFTLTNYKGIDPALMGTVGYPNTRKYNLTINLGF